MTNGLAITWQIKTGLRLRPQSHSAAFEGRKQVPKTKIGGTSVRHRVRNISEDFTKAFYFCMKWGQGRFLAARPT